MAGTKLCTQSYINVLLHIYLCSVQALIFASRYPEVQETMNGIQCDEDAAVLNLELLIRVVLQNRSVMV